jgi:autotransporter-associated beta strand protein
LGDTVDINSQIVDQAGAGNWSLSAWVRTTAGGSAFVSKNAGATTWNAGHSVYYLASNPIGSAGSLPTGVRNGGGFVQGDPTPASVTDGNWHLVTFVDNGGTKTVYVDGVAATMTMTGFTTADTSTFVRLGYNTDTVATDGAANFSGDLDEIKFFSIALNGTQVLGLFNNNVVPGGGSQYLPTATPVTLGASGATLDLSDNNQVIGSLTGVAGSNVLLGTGNLTTGGDNTSTTFAGVIGGNGGVVKTGSGTFTMTGANTYSGGTSVNAGTLIADKLSNGTISISGGLAKLTAKGTANNVSGTTVVPALTITGGSLDTTNNAMVLITANTSPATLRGYLQSGSLTSSTTAGGFAIGYADNSTLGRTTFGGVSVDATKLLVGFVYSGDSNLDGRVNALDFNAVASNFGGASKFWTNGDFSYDGTVNTVDFNALALNFNRSEPTPVPGLGALVPEPASMGAILMAGGWAMLHRRRRTMK